MDNGGGTDPHLSIQRIERVVLYLSATLFLCIR